MHLASSKVMIVDDEVITQQLLSLHLANQFEVITCSSGEQTLSLFDSIKPDLILLDIDMPGLNGYETCKQLRKKGITEPIIFVTSYENSEVHLEAYDSGGNDIITKPVDPEILIRKATLAIRQKAEAEKLSEEVRSMRDMTANFLTNVGENSILLHFVGKAVAVESHDDLARQLVEAVHAFGVTCCVMLNHEDGQTMLSSHGVATDLEQAILRQMSDKGRLVEFKQQFIVNYDLVSLMICCAPMDPPEKVERIRDNAAILALHTEALCKNLSMRIKSMQRADQMQIAVMAAGTAVEKVSNNHKHLLLDTRVLLQKLVDKVESTYSKLNITRTDEVEISKNMHESVNEILSLLSTENNFDDEIAKVHEALSIERKNNEHFLF